jgi:DNA polymerase
MPERKPNTHKLVSDIRERVQYMQELGVGDFSVLMPQTDRVLEPASLRNARTLEAQQKVVPAAEIAALLSGLEKKDKPSGKKPEPRKRRDLLSSTKISEMSAHVNEIEIKEPTSAPVPIVTPAAADANEEVNVESNQMKDQSNPKTDESLEDIQKDIGSECSRCELCEKRTQVVNSVGSATADLMIIGEAPGADEDEQGKPFVGRAGKLLTKILEAVGFERDDVFIGNINRCRPPANRQPTPEESATCKPFLLREIASVKPKVIVVLGNTATKNLLQTKTGITQLRGNFAEFEGVKVMPTFHPAYLLRDPRKKREVWDDMKKVRAFLDEN